MKITFGISCALVSIAGAYNGYNYAVLQYNYDKRLQALETQRQQALETQQQAEQRLLENQRRLDELEQEQENQRLAQLNNPQQM